MTPAELAASQETGERLKLRARAMLVEQLAAGADSDQAVVETVRSLCRRRLYGEAVQLAKAALGVPGLQDGGRAGLAVSMLARGRFGAADVHMRVLDRSVALKIAPADLVACEFARDPDLAGHTMQHLLLDNHPLPPETWVQLARTAFGRGRPDLARQAAERVSSAAQKATRAQRYEARWLSDWAERATSQPSPPAIGRDRVGFGVLDYKQPDFRQTSANIGDYVQTLASLGHLVRHQNVRFHGEKRLVGTLNDLQSRIQPSHRRDGAARDVDVVLVNRDASSLDAVPEGTWMLAFGWYMHSWFRIRYDFPFHPNLRPIFVSFHLNHPAAVPDESIDYLRQRGPVGCRDWDTVYHLLERDVPAFFSGCLTTTVSVLYPAEKPAVPKRAPAAFVDLVKGTEPSTRKPWFAVTHSYGEVRKTDFVTNLNRARDILDSYRTDFAFLATSRLHCYLPTRALGIDTRFRPKNPNDIRFDGLIGIDDHAFKAMQTGLHDKIEQVMTAILSGASEEEARGVWATACAADVEIAKHRYEARTQRGS